MNSVSIGQSSSLSPRLQYTSALSGSEDLLAQLLGDQNLVANKTAKEGLEEMKLLMSYMNVFGIMPRVCLFVHFFFLYT